MTAASPPEKLPVIFRAERTKAGEVTAVFPTLPHDAQGMYFTVYAHVGQHGAGGFDWYRRTRAAKPAEYADLLAELKDIYEHAHWEGDEAFKLVVCQRYSAHHHRAFRAEVARMRKVGA